MFRQSAPLADHRVRSLAFIVAGAALWLLTRPFTFRENDGVLYALMALARLNPERFNSDLFLAFGSQDSFSAFSPLYAALISAFGLAPAAMILLLASAALWIFASWRLTKTLIPVPLKAGVAFLFLCTLRVGYAGWRMPVGDGVLTSRILSEALTILALSYASERRWFRTAALCICAMAFHPLMGVAGIAVAFLTVAFARPRWLWLVPLGTTAFVALVLTQVPPFDRVLTTVDEVWLAEIHHRNGYVFLSDWSIDVWARLTMQCTVLALAAWRSVGWQRRAFSATLLVGLGGTLVSGIGADLLHNALVIQLQLWRCIWPMAWATIPAILVLWREREGLHGSLSMAAFGTSLLTRDPILISALTVLGLLAEGSRNRLSPLVRKSLFAVVAIIFVAAQVERIYPMVFRPAADVVVAKAGWELPYFFGWILAPILAFAVLMKPRVGLALAALSLIGAGWRWDQRSDWMRYLTSETPPPVATSGPVLWGGDAAQTWFLLRQASFLSLQQASGLLFSRDQSVAWRQRINSARGLVPDDPWYGAETKDCDQVRPQLSQSDLADICVQPQHPVSVITPRRIGGTQEPSATFDIALPHQIVCLSKGKNSLIEDRHFYRYDCQANH